MKRLYYDSVKEELHCQVGSSEEDGEGESESSGGGHKMLSEFVNMSNINYMLKSGGGSSSSTTHDPHASSSTHDPHASSTHDPHEEEESETSSNSCDCVYLNANDTNRFVMLESNLKSQYFIIFK